MWKLLYLATVSSLNTLIYFIGIETKELENIKGALSFCKIEPYYKREENGYFSSRGSMSVLMRLQKRKMREATPPLPRSRLSKGGKYKWIRLFSLTLLSKTIITNTGFGEDRSKVLSTKVRIHCNPIYLGLMWPVWDFRMGEITDNPNFTGFLGNLRGERLKHCFATFALFCGYIIAVPYWRRFNTRLLYTCTVNTSNT